jgi:hypothetical protein
VAIDKNRMTIAAAASDIGNLVLAADNLDAATDRLHYVQQNRVTNIFGLVPDFLLQLHADLKSALGCAGDHRANECRFPAASGTNALLPPLKGRNKRL